MNKRKLMYMIGIIGILFMMVFIDMSFTKEETSVSINNVEALAEQEVDIFKLCPESGGHCCVNINLDVYGICMAVD